MKVGNEVMKNSRGAEEKLSINILSYWRYNPLWTFSNYQLKLLEPEFYI